MNGLSSCRAQVGVLEEVRCRAPWVRREECLGMELVPVGPSAADGMPRRLSPPPAWGG